MKRKVTFSIMIFAISALSLSLFGQQKKVICIEYSHEADGPYGKYTDSTSNKCTYKNITIVNIALWSPMQGAAFSNYSIIYKVTSSGKVITKLSDLLNEKANELLNNINDAYRAHYDSLVYAARSDNGLASCMESTGGTLEKFSFDEISIAFSDNNTVTFIASLGMCHACLAFDVLSYTLKLEEFDKYLKP